MLQLIMLSFGKCDPTEADLIVLSHSLIIIIIIIILLTERKFKRY